MARSAALTEGTLPPGVFGTVQARCCPSQYQHIGPGHGSTAVVDGPLARPRGEVQRCRHHPLG